MMFKIYKNSVGYFPQLAEERFIKNCSWIPPSLLGGGKEQARGAG